eukprot:gene27806-30835_t
MAWIAYANATFTAELVTDRILGASATTIAEQITVEDGVIAALIPPAALGILTTGVRDRALYQVLGPDGGLLAGLPDVPAPPKPSRGTTQLAFYEAEFRGQPVRAVVLHQPLAGVPGGAAASGAEATVIVAVTTKDRDQMIRSLWWQGVQPMAVMLLLIAGLGWFGLDRGLKPLDALRLAVAARSADHLSPVPLGSIPAEVRPLVIAFNDVLQRLDRYIEAQRRFIANAAHQMRTPLTLLKLQTHYGLTDESSSAKAEALTALDRGLDALVRLIGQLLILARAEPRTPTKPDVKPVDMVELVGDVLIAMGPLALDRQIDLGLESSLDETARPRVKASPTLLREMLINLVDNALRYTPAGGMVTVGLAVAASEPATSGEADAQPSGWLAISVSDDGPGIAEAERERVFERFYR